MSFVSCIYLVGTRGKRPIDINKKNDQHHQLCMPCRQAVVAPKRLEQHGMTKKMRWFLISKRKFVMEVSVSGD